ncbi:MAG: transporter substrate-binding domain-containing protein [Opitutaceae bacterium]|nr:transporter substrate-binding domain-containing protein [Opitutaceae bacterium]
MTRSVRATAVSLLVVGWLCAPAHAQDEAGGISIEGRPSNAAVIVGAATNMYPYAYEEGGRLQGFAVDIFDAVAREMGIKASRLPINNNNAGTMLMAGRIDLILFWAETPERQKEMSLSTPLLTLQTVVVVRADEQRIRTAADLEGRVIATGSRGTVASTYVRDHVKGATEVFATHPEEILMQVSSGLADAAVLSRLTAAARIDRLGLKNLRILDEGIEGYDVRYGFMVRRGDDRLLARLNEGITLIHRDGSYARIYDAWFGRHEPRRFTREQVVAYVAAALALGLVILLIPVLRQRRLSGRLVEQARELSAERTLQAMLFDTHPAAVLVLEADAPGAPARLVSANRAAASLYGIDSAVSAGCTLAGLGLRSEIQACLAEIEARWPDDDSTVVLTQSLLDSRRTLETTLRPLSTGEHRRRLCVVSVENPRRPTPF